MQMLGRSLGLVSAEIDHRNAVLKALGRAPRVVDRAARRRPCRTSSTAPRGRYRSGCPLPSASVVLLSWKDDSLFGPLCAPHAGSLGLASAGVHFELNDFVVLG